MKTYINKKIIGTVLAIAIFATCISGCGNKNNDDTTTEAVTTADSTSTVDATEAETSDKEVVFPEKDIDWDELKAENDDIYAWLYVPGTDVDYPVLSSKEGVDADYYLDHNQDGSYGPYPGAIYSQNTYNKTDFTDFNLILYGHNMKNGTMFSSLHNFEDKAVFDENKYIYVYTPDKNYAYYIFAAYVEEDYLLPATFGFDFDYGRIQYIDYVFSKAEEKSLSSHIDTTVELQATDKLITLSTCMPKDETHRFLVQGVMVTE